MMAGVKGGILFPPPSIKQLAVCNIIVVFLLLFPPEAPCGGHCLGKGCVMEQWSDLVCQIPWSSIQQAINSFTAGFALQSKSPVTC